MYLRYNLGTLAHLPILGSSSILLPIEATQFLIKDLEQLQEDFFYKGQRVQEERTYINIKDGN